MYILSSYRSIMKTQLNRKMDKEYTNAVLRLRHINSQYLYANMLTLTVFKNPRYHFLFFRRKDVKKCDILC